VTYFLSPALVTLRAEINSLWPHRDKTSDGWIGDASHAARPSDHNPDWGDGGIVRATDTDEDLGTGLATVGAAMPLVNAIIRDPRVAYVIYEGRIWQNPAVFAVGGWRAYTGVNAHRHHVHVSVRRGARWDRDGRTWNLAAAVASQLGGTGAIPAAPDLAPPTPIVPQEPDMPELIFKATSSAGVIESGWSYIQQADGTLRALTSQEHQARLYAHKAATGRDYPVVSWAGTDLHGLAIACGLWEYTGSRATGPIGLTGRLIGRNAPYSPGSTYGTSDREYPITKGA
jgi:hypothetical protein